MRSTTEYRQITDTDSDISSVESDAQKVRLSFIDGQLSKPTWILNIPLDILITLSTKPRKWLCYAAYVICGANGKLQSYNEHQDLVYAELEGVVHEGDHFVYRLTGGADFVDRWARGYKHSRTSVSQRSNDVLGVVRKYYGGCPFTQLPEDASECCHLIPQIKGSAYLRAVLRTRGGLNEDMDIDDPGNIIVLSPSLHKIFDEMQSIAFLATPNAFLRSNELPGNEAEDPEKYLVTLHAFKRLPIGHVPHGKSSDMTRGSGLENPPYERHLIKDNLPRNTLLEVCYAVALLAQWGSERFKLSLDKRAERFYSCGGVRRGEDQEGSMRREEKRRERVNHSISRHLSKRDSQFNNAFLWMPFILRGISPEDVKAKREEDRRKVEREEAERIGRWQEEVYEQSSEDGVGYETEPGYPCPLPEANDENPVSLDKALSRHSHKLRT